MTKMETWNYRFPFPAFPTVWMCFPKHGNDNPSPQKRRTSVGVFDTRPWKPPERPRAGSFHSKLTCTRWQCFEIFILGVFMPKLFQGIGVVFFKWETMSIYTPWVGDWGGAWSAAWTWVRGYMSKLMSKEYKANREAQRWNRYAIRSRERQKRLAT